MDWSSEIRDLRNEIQAINRRTDELVKMFTENSERQSARSDRLYEMFIDLVRTQKSRTDP